MRVLQINTVFPSGSTGKICKGIAEKCFSADMENYVAYAHGDKQGAYEITVSSWLDHHLHNRLARMTMGIGCFSHWYTRKFLKKVKKLQPDIIHLHNLHANYINVSMLFHFIKQQNIPVVWTLHDCWAYTGYCAYYTMAQCDKWKRQCESCPNRHADPVTRFDFSRTMFRKKRKMFSDVKNMTIVTPSDWLKQEVLQSFLAAYPVRVIPNGIDLSLFRPRTSDFRTKYHIDENRFIVLGVAFSWERRKGLDVFLQLAERLGDRYQIVLVGTNDAIDAMLPPSILSVHRTKNQEELAELYSAADVFVNPTREENYPTVNMEAIACGTPVVTFDTGGSAEMLNATCGSVVAVDDIDTMEKEIRCVCEMNVYTQEDCLRQAQTFDMHTRFEEYVNVYKEVIHDRVAEN